jgi:ABC-type glycerol-3-phosphate transport system substrate-binding protein
MLALGVLATATACGGSSGGSSDGAGQPVITLVVEDFGNFGYKKLIREYEQAHPNIKVVERVGEYNKHHEDLAKHLDAGTGAGDVVAVEEGYVVQFRNRSKDFVNLLDHGAGQLAEQWLPWKWQDTLSADGKVQIGLGTDIGGLGMCYRSDLFKQAGLPTDPPTGKRSPDCGPPGRPTSPPVAASRRPTFRHSGRTPRRTCTTRCSRSRRSATSTGRRSSSPAPIPA